MQEIRNLQINEVEDKMYESEVDNIIISLFSKLELKQYHKGYRYMYDAIQLTISDYRYCETITKSVYPKLAKKYHTTPGAIERCIRHLIRNLNMLDVFTLIEVFGYNSMMYTNKEALMALSNYTIRIYNRDRQEKISSTAC